MNLSPNKDCSEGLTSSGLLPITQQQGDLPFVPSFSSLNMSNYADYQEYLRNWATGTKGVRDGRIPDEEEIFTGVTGLTAIDTQVYRDRQIQFIGIEEPFDPEAKVYFIYLVQKDAEQMAELIRRRKPETPVEVLTGTVLRTVSEFSGRDISSNLGTARFMVTSTRQLVV